MVSPGLAQAGHCQAPHPLPRHAPTTPISAQLFRKLQILSCLTLFDVPFPPTDSLTPKPTLPQHPSGKLLLMCQDSAYVSLPPGNLP